MPWFRKTASHARPYFNLADPASCAQLYEELNRALHDIAEAWFPITIDHEHGGFLCDFDYRWRPSGPQHKMSEYQTRMARLTARLAAQPGFESCATYAKHGFQYLQQVLWDNEYGGWYRMLDRAGKPLENASKHAHGISYAIDACSAYTELTGDPDALKLAHDGFAWLERYGHDETYGGYFALFRRDGTRITSPADSPIPGAVRDCIGTPFGLKDANTNGDMLECINDLFKVAPSPHLKQRLDEMLHIMRDRMVVPPGSVHMYCQPDWTPVPDLARYSYIINSSNILAKISRTIGIDDCERTCAVVKSMVDTALTYGWDNKLGGFYYGGSTFGPTHVEDVIIYVTGKYWWPQIEGCRALLRLALLHPSDPMRYEQRFNQLWNYINQHIIDHKHGGWYSIGTDCRPRRSHKPKATTWKEPSHEVHSLLECLRLLKSADQARPATA